MTRPRRISTEDAATAQRLLADTTAQRDAIATGYEPPRRGIRGGTGDEPPEDRDGDADEPGAD